MHTKVSSTSREEMLVVKAWDYLAARRQFGEQQGEGGVNLVLSYAPKRRLRGKQSSIQQEI